MQNPFLCVLVAGSDRPAIVSPEDFERVNAFRWHIDARPNSAGILIPRRVRTNYRMPGSKTRMVSLHQLVMDFPGMLIDHKNGDVLDNRRENLRLTDKRGNRANARPSGARSYKGITPHHGKWEACIVSGGKRLYLGLHATPEQAAKAYDAAAEELFGAFARLNFPAPSSGSFASA